MNREEAIEIVKKKIEEEKLKKSSYKVSRHITTLDELIDNSNLESKIEEININSDKVDDLENVKESISSSNIKSTIDLQKNMDVEDVKDDNERIPLISTNLPKNTDNSIEEKLTPIAKEKNIIIVDKIILEISVELTHEERNNGIKLCHRGFSIPVDNSIYMLFNLLISEENDFHVKFSDDATISGTYHQLEPSENQNNPGYNRGKVEIRIHQDDRVEQDILPSKIKVFELLLGDYEVNYYLNNFYNYIKGQKKLLESEVKYYEENILKKVLEAKKILEMSHTMNTSKITKILNNINIENSVGVEEKKVDNKQEKEMKKRWKDRFSKGIKHITTGGDGNYIHAFNYKNQGFELELLADILKMEIAPLRRLIKRLEKKTNKKYIFTNEKGTKIVDNTKGKVISKKEKEEVYSKRLGFVTFEGFFEILAYIRSL